VTASASTPNTPPKQLIRAVLRLQAVPLARGAHCNGVGTERSDVDIGDYLSGLAAELVDGGRNWIETSAERAADPRSGAPAWRARVVLRRVLDRLHRRGVTAQPASALGARHSGAAPTGGPPGGRWRKVSDT
jgi:hypothetical protein